jgi:prevent-host-death family protein
MMTNVVSALTARTQLGQIIKRASENNERFVIGRRGEPKVIVMSIRDYIDTVAPAPEELKAMQETAKRSGTNKLTMRDINAEIAAYRKERQQKEQRNSPKK